MLMLVALVASTSPLPYTAVAMVPLLWAAVESVRSIQARSAGRAPTRSIVSSVVALVLVGVLTLIVLLPYAFYGVAKNLQDCTAGANTAIAAADCDARFNKSLDSILGGFLSAGQHAGG
jgi:hypothetical protein